MSTFAVTYIMKKSFFLIFLLTSYLSLDPDLFAQNSNNYDNKYVIKGQIKDSKSDTKVIAAKIQILGTNKGTFSDKNGEFRLPISKLPLDLKISSLGYKSKTITVTKEEFLKVALEVNPIRTGTVVKTDEISAEQIIERAIAKKQENLDLIRTLKGDLYSKVTLDLDGSAFNESSTNGNSISINLGSSKSEKNRDEYKNFIMETFSYNQLDYKKKINNSTILQRRQTANIPAKNNLIVISTFQDFYQNEVKIINTEFVTPIADNALSYYNFRIKEKKYQEYKSQENKNQENKSIQTENDKSNIDDSRYVYVLEVRPKSDVYPAFSGEISIVEGTYNLIEINLKPNKEFAIEYFRNLSYKQKFEEIESKYWVPMYLEVEGMMDVEFLSGMINLQANVNVSSIYNNVKINETLPDSVYKQDFKINAVADVDSVKDEFWEKNGLRELSEKEKATYIKIDSIVKINKALDTIPASNFGMSILPYLGFNRVSSVDLGVDLKFKVAQTFDVNFTPHYAFGMKELLFNSELAISPIKPSAENPQEELRFSVGFDKDLTKNYWDNSYHRLLNTISAGLMHKDYYDYQFANKFNFKVQYEYKNLLINAGYYQADTSARTVSTNNSWLSYLDEEELYSWRKNMDVNLQNAHKTSKVKYANLDLSYSFDLDLGLGSREDKVNFKIDMGLISIFANDNFDLINKIEDKNRLGYKASLALEIPTFYTGYERMQLDLKVSAGKIDDDVHWMYKFRMPTSDGIFNRFGNMLSSKIGIIGGNEFTSYSMSFNTQDLLWRALSLPTHKNRGLDLILFASAARYNDKQSFEYQTTNNQYYSEMGIGLGRIPTFISDFLFLRFDLGIGVGPLASKNTGFSIGLSGPLSSLLK